MKITSDYVAMLDTLHRLGKDSTVQYHSAAEFISERYAALASALKDTDAYYTGRKRGIEAALSDSMRAFVPHDPNDARLFREMLLRVNETTRQDAVNRLRIDFSKAVCNFIRRSFPDVPEFAANELDNSDGYGIVNNERNTDDRR